MTSLGALETSLYWQRHVLAVSRDPEQKARAKRAIERLEQQIEEEKHDGSA
jgi:hypothetical protein